jgi:predicted Rossmann-fold nucleotide-binding protein
VNALTLTSGGQTGVDRAALDVALELGLRCGGWCPKGRRAEDGVISARYLLRETPSDDYAQRTEWNVRDADATLVLTRGEPTEGTALTIELAARHQKPCLVVDLNAEPQPQAVADWVARHRPRTLNVAGPRESKSPGIYERARAFLREALRHEQGPRP